MSEPLSVADYEQLARERVDARLWAYFEGGAADEVTLRDNLAAYGRWRFRPRVLVEVETCSTRTTVLGTEVALPVLVAPIAYHTLLDPEGERATARACAAAGTIMGVSTFTGFSHAELAAAAPGLVQWAQLYVFRDEGATNAHLDEAAAAGCTAILLTVDAPVLGRRERDVRAGFVLPTTMQLPYAPKAIAGREHNPSHHSSILSASVTWRDIEKIAGRTRLPVVVKGLVTREDAVLAVEHGAAAIVVSNHGGRQLDGAPASLDALPEVVEAVEGRVEVLVDGGIRRGTDVLKALALGAKATLVGRPSLYGLAAAGERGVAHVLELLRAEVELGLALLGCTSPDEVGRGHVQAAVPYDQLA